MNRVIAEYPPEGTRLVEGRCPNMGNLCNCIGMCRPILVVENDPRTDDEVRAARRNHMSWSVMPLPPCNTDCRGEHVKDCHNG